MSCFYKASQSSEDFPINSPATLDLLQQFYRHLSTASIFFLFSSDLPQGRQLKRAIADNSQL